jgi:hypothetical protein
LDRDTNGSINGGSWQQHKLWQLAARRAISKALILSINREFERKVDTAK